MSTTQKSATWQPTYWDHLFYRWIKFEGKSQSWVANNFPVSQPTISRMLCRYERWQARTAPRDKGQLDHDERLRAQRWLTYERNEVILHSCLRVAEKLEGFTDVSRTVERSKEYSRQVKDTTTTMAVMDRTGTMARFLRLAFRVNMEQFKLSQLDPLPPLEPLTADEVAELDAQDSAALVEWTDLLQRLDKQPEADCSRHTPCAVDSECSRHTPCAVEVAPNQDAEDQTQQPKTEDQKPEGGIPFNLNLTPELHPDFEYWRAQQAAEDAELDRQVAAGHFAAEVAGEVPATFAATDTEPLTTDTSLDDMVGTAHPTHSPVPEPSAPIPSPATPVNDVHKMNNADLPQIAATADQPCAYSRGTPAEKFCSACITADDNAMPAAWNAPALVGVS